MTKIIGLTGGIGSGKSTVLRLFAEKNAPYYIADIEAKMLMESDAGLRKKIIEYFGEQAYNDDNRLNTGYIASIVFTQPEELKALNAMVHPVVHADFLSFAKKIKVPYLIYENAILYESGADAFCDAVILVTAPEEERIRRVMFRDGVSEQQVRDRIRNQWSEERKKALADYIITNIDPGDTQHQVDELHRLFIEKYG